ncbi:hypothetical protein [Segniliparus rugosus]|uniref:Uncharacterized protein n=1 Tax=Segniliparus rugosus (strain ATCC BAA-974 / DSM 45345 / CCUG 50838 / CIP 108380 / JCM 13579 / CDC 945) TaxID=679197 RepID=U1N5K1_SEGRC|nr:hypothetical protein [Segniliparus rugosus]ERG69414.1 hypothetical protein HMPREF9336_04110 [Segniliparus rugosus ATCC BAA-974]
MGQDYAHFAIDQVNRVIHWATRAGMTLIKEEMDFLGSIIGRPDLVQAATEAVGGTALNELSYAGQGLRTSTDNLKGFWGGVGCTAAIEYLGKLLGANDAVSQTLKNTAKALGELNDELADGLGAAANFIQNCAITLERCEASISQRFGDIKNTIGFGAGISSDIHNALAELHGHLSKLTDSIKDTSKRARATFNSALQTVAEFQVPSSISDVATKGNWEPVPR